MFGIGIIGFAAPAALAGLLALPLIWLLLRNLPPPARLQTFPPVSLMTELRDRDSESDSCPLWLRILRILAAAAAILGCAQPVVRSLDSQAETDRPILILLDASWAGAPDWEGRMQTVGAILDEAQSGGRPVLVISMTDAGEQITEFREAGEWKGELAELSPNPWLPDAEITASRLAGLPVGEFDTYWLSDGLRLSGGEGLASLLAERGRVAVIGGQDSVNGLLAAEFSSGAIQVPVVRSIAAGSEDVRVAALGAGPSGRDLALAESAASFEAGSRLAAAEFRLPLEVANRIESFRIAGPGSAGSVSLVSGGTSLRRVALFSGRETEEAGRLLSQLHYLRSAFLGAAELIEKDLLPAVADNPDMIILADVASLSAEEQAVLEDWVSGGGVLVRFAGPRLASSAAGRDGEGALFPVRLRGGGRAVGGSMSWGPVRRIKPFSADSPFHGLAIPDDIEISAQLLAQPGPGLAKRVLAELDDGTPLVTARPAGEGRVVMFHVSANAEWSNLPLSGLMPAMLNRLALSGRAPQGVFPDRADQVEWKPVRLLDAHGRLIDAEGLAPVPGPVMVQPNPESRRPPGIYESGDLTVAVGAVAEAAGITPAVFPPPVQRIQNFEVSGMRLGGALLALAVILLSVDALASVWIGGRLLKPVSAVLVFAAAANAPGAPWAQESDNWAVRATSDTSIAYVISGVSRIDAASAAGLSGLSSEIAARTTLSLGEPFGVNPESDELGFFPLLYWPTSGVPLPLSGRAVRNLNAYLRNGGMILLDSADAVYGGAFSGAEGAGQMRRLAELLDLPALRPVPDDHILTRSFYRLNEFPGRYDGTVWVEAGANAGMGLPHLADRVNDGVTPLVAGGNDWASAWALSDGGMPLFSTGLGAEGQLRREKAVRFGVNLVMHALTGHYKSDQLQLEALSKMSESR